MLVRTDCTATCRLVEVKLSPDPTCPQTDYAVLHRTVAPSAARRWLQNDDSAFTAASRTWALIRSNSLTIASRTAFSVEVNWRAMLHRKPLREGSPELKERGELQKARRLKLFPKKLQRTIKLLCRTARVKYTEHSVHIDAKRLGSSFRCTIVVISPPILARGNFQSPIPDAASFPECWTL